jgi:Protein of unknown function (DUF2846)
LKADGSARSTISRRSKSAGASDAVIAAVIKAGARKTKASNPSDTAPLSTSAPARPGAKATVYVYRPGKLFGKTLEPSVFLDEQKLLDMDNARYFALKLDPGRHIIRSNEKDSEIDQTWEPNKTYYVKITIAAGMMKGHGQMGMVTESLALKELQRLRPLDRENVEANYLPLVDLTPIE